MVDTGSVYSWLPGDDLRSLDIRVERRQRFVTADGRLVERDVGFAIVHAGGRATADDVVFALPGDLIVLGARTLEGLNVRVDLPTRRLVPAGPVPAALALPLTGNIVGDYGLPSVEAVRYEEIYMCHRAAYAEQSCVSI